MRGPLTRGRTRTLTASDVAKPFTGCARSSPVGVTAGATTPVSVNIECRLPQLVTTPPARSGAVPAIALLAFALLAAGASATRRDGRRSQPRPCDAPPSEKGR
jgi:hypothetical protein